MGWSPLSISIFLSCVPRSHGKNPAISHVGALCNLLSQGDVIVLNHLGAAVNERTSGVRVRGA